MSEFKVGDRVRLTANNEGFGRRGDEGIIDTIDGDATAYIKFTTGIREGESWWADLSSIELVGPKFKVGDRVSLHSYPYFLESNNQAGTITGRAKDEWRGEWSVAVDNYEDTLGFFEREMTLLPVSAPLTIEAGKFYMTRDGRRVGPMERCHGFWRIDGDGEGNPGHYTSDGVSAFRGELPRPEMRAGYDLVALAPDAEEKRADKPKFKVGDRVNITYGHGWDGPATVTSVHDTYLCAFCANGDEGGFSYKFVEPLTPPPAIVCLIENGQPLPATRPHVHASVEAATKEAARLASVKKGQEFGVYELVATRREEDYGVKVGDTVMLRVPAKVTGLCKGNANIVTGGGGSFVLPRRDLQAA